MSDTTALSVYVAFAELDAARRAYDAAAAEASEKGWYSWDRAGRWHDERRQAEERFCEALNAYVDRRIAGAPFLAALAEADRAKDAAE